MKTPKQANKFMFFMLLYSFVLPQLLGILFQFAGIDTTTQSFQKALLFAQDIPLFVIPIAVAALLGRIRPTKLFAHSRLSLSNIAFIIVMTLLFMPTMTLTAEIASLFVSTDVNNYMLDYVYNLGTFPAIIALALFPAIFEEITCRGLVLNGYRRNGIVLASFISGLFFGLIHMDIYQMCYAIFAGAFFSFLVIYTNSIFSSMLAHFIINGSQVLFLKLYFIVSKLSLNDILVQAQAQAAQASRYGGIITYLCLSMVTLPFFFILAMRFAKHNKEKASEFVSNGIDNNESIAITQPFDIWFFLTLVLAAILFTIIAITNN